MCIGWGQEIELGWGLPLLAYEETVADRCNTELEEYLGLNDTEGDCEWGRVFEEEEVLETVL